MTSIEGWKFRFASWILYPLGYVPIEQANLKSIMKGVNQFRNFTDRSGFLRDGRYPGGRHAERKILRIVNMIEIQHRAGKGVDRCTSRN